MVVRKEVPNQMRVLSTIKQLQDLFLEIFIKPSTFKNVLKTGSFLQNSH